MLTITCLPLKLLNVNYLTNKYMSEGTVLTVLLSLYDKCLTLKAIYNNLGFQRESERESDRQT